MFETPILLIGYNRPHKIKCVIEQINKVNPKYVYFVQDGSKNKKDKKLVDETTKVVKQNIKSECLFINKRNKNLGSKENVSSGIDWFFNNVEQGIILEDDCVPSKSFFFFCEELLNKYKNHKKVMTITGQNMLGQYNTKNSYVFSKDFYCWGWATWKDRFKSVNFNFKNYSKEILATLYKNPIKRFIKKKSFNDSMSKVVDVWDVPFSFEQRFQRKFSIIPKHNLVENIGFSSESTHTKENKIDQKYLQRDKRELYFPLLHPQKIIFEKNFDTQILLHEIKRLVQKKLLKS